jgi:hypothetical protein
MVGKVTATSIEANHRAIRPLDVIASVYVYCIGLDTVCDNYPLEGIELKNNQIL